MRVLHGGGAYCSRPSLPGGSGSPPRRRGTWQGINWGAGVVPGSPRSGRARHRQEATRREQGSDRGERTSPVPVIDPVVPGEPERLGPGAGGGETEPETLVAPIEQARTEAEAAELPPNRPARDRAGVGPEAPVARPAGGKDRVGREHSVLEREGDALAHERIDAGRIAHEERVG